MIYFIIAIAFLAISENNSPISLAQAHSQGPSVTVTPFNAAGMPVRVNSATAEYGLGQSWVDYSVSNMSGEDILGIYLRVFITDSDNKLIKVRESFSGKRIAAGVTQRDRAQIKGNVEQPIVAFLTVSKVVTTSGVWQVADSALETAIQSKLNHQSETTLSATFQSNATTTERDRSQIFELILGDILQDEKKVERLRNQTRVIVLRDSVNFDLPHMPQANLIALDQQEIQRIADEEQRVVFLRFEPLTSEGSRVLAKIVLRDAVARRSGIHVPYKFTFLFTCVKENGRWIVEKSIGYAQS